MLQREHSAILTTIIKLPFVIKIFVLSIFKWPFYTGFTVYYPGLFPAILGKGPWPKLGKMINLTSNLGETNGIEHNKGSKIYPQNQVILDCIMPIIPL